MAPTRALLPSLLLALALLATASTLLEPTATPGPRPVAPAVAPAAPTPTAAPSPPAPAPLDLLAPVAPLGSSGPGAAPPAEATPEGAALVVGSVRWPDGRPAAHLPVHGVGGVHAHGGGTYTDAEGLFQAEVPPGVHTVRVWSGDQTSAAGATVEAQAGRRAIVDLVLAPLARVTVWLAGPRGRRPADDVSGEWLDGRPRDPLRGQGGVLHLGPGPVRLFAHRPDGTPCGAAEVEVGTSPLEVVIPVADAGLIAGLLVDPAGAPGADVEVGAWRVDPADPDRVPRAGWRARSGPDGRFALEHLPAGRYALRAERVAGRLLGEVEVDVAEGAREELRLPLAPAGELRGRVVAPEGRGHGQVRLELRRRSDGALVERLRAGSGDGSFASDWLADGDYVLSVPAAWLERLARAAQVARVAAAPVEVRLAGGRDAEVELRVVAAP